MSITVVVPTIREDCMKKWLDEWREDLGDVKVIVVEDNPVKSFKISGVDHYAWDDIDRDLGKDSWIIPRRTSACRSYGFLKALETGSDFIWTTDDDCYPETANKGKYLDAYSAQLHHTIPDDRWFNTIQGTMMFPRGYPYNIRGETKPVAVHHGLWSNIPDLDGMTQLANPDFRLTPRHTAEVVPYGRLFPFCIMNVAFRREFTPALFMLLMGKDKDLEPWGFDRFDDIWAGIFVKRIADHLGYAVTSGYPGVHHSRASNPQRNKELEALGVVAHEDFWGYLLEHELTGLTVADCYREFGSLVKSCKIEPPKIRTNYWTHLGNAMQVWSRLAKERE